MNKRIFFSIVTALLVVVIGVASALVLSGRDLAIARQAAARYARMDLTLADGFTPLFECISDPTAGGMGFHYVRADRLDATLELSKPEALVYAPKADGRRELLAVEYIIPAADWSGSEPPAFLGQALQYKTAVGRHSVDPYYALHVWLWGDNPSGMFADWNPEVTCPESASVDASSLRWVALGAAYGASRKASVDAPSSSAASGVGVGGILEPIVAASARSYSGDDPYDPAAGGQPEMSISAASGQSAVRASSAGVGGILEPIVVASARSYSGDDPYDPAAGGQPELSIAVASGQSAVRASSAGVGGILEPIVAASARSYSGDDPYDPAAGGQPEMSIAVASGQSIANASSAGLCELFESIQASSSRSYSGDDPYDPAAGGYPELWMAVAGGAIC
jgi:hypothetical protein